MSLAPVNMAFRLQPAMPAQVAAPDGQVKTTTAGPPGHEPAFFLDLMVGQVRDYVESRFIPFASGINFVKGYTSPFLPENDATKNPGFGALLVDQYPNQLHFGVVVEPTATEATFLTNDYTPEGVADYFVQARGILMTGGGNSFGIGARYLSESEVAVVAGVMLYLTSNTSGAGFIQLVSAPDGRTSTGKSFPLKNTQAVTLRIEVAGDSATSFLDGVEQEKMTGLLQVEAGRPAFYMKSAGVSDNVRLAYVEAGWLGVAPD